MRKLIYLFIFFISFPPVGNSQWFAQYSGVNSTLRDIVFINSNTGWVCGSDGIILKTTNGGVNWINQYNEAVGKSLYGIYPVTENIVFCVEWFETIFTPLTGVIPLQRYEVFRRSW